MSSNFIENLRSICRIEIVEATSYDYVSNRIEDIRNECMRNNIILIRSNRVALLSSVGLRKIIKDDVDRAWSSYPPPPDGISNLDIIVLMLCSEGYTFNVMSFGWPKTTENTFMCIWRFIDRLCNVSSKMPELITLLNGRGLDGYIIARGLEKQFKVTETNLIDLIPDMFTTGPLRLCIGDDGKEEGDNPKIVSYSELVENIEDIQFSTIMGSISSKKS